MKKNRAYNRFTASTFSHSLLPQSLTILMNLNDSRFHELLNLVSDFGVSQMSGKVCQSLDVTMNRNQFEVELTLAQLSDPTASVRGSFSLLDL